MPQENSPIQHIAIDRASLGLRAAPRTRPIRVEACTARTHPGAVRALNEDAFLSLPELPLFAVADGTGGEGSGDVAATLALSVIEQQAERIQEQLLIADEALSERSRLVIGKRLGELLVRASRTVYEEVQRLGQEKMSTSLLLATLTSNELHIAHAGNVRAYLLRDREMMPLTDDHSVAVFQYRRGRLSANSLQSSPLRNRLYQVLGAEIPPEPEVAGVALIEGDQILLCTDGLSNVLPDDVMVPLIADRSTQEATEALLQAALERGAPDNISMILIRVSATNYLASLEERSERLRTIPLFADLSEPDRRQIASLMEMRRLPVGSSLFREGDPGEAFYLILEGRVRLSRQGANLVDLGPGQPLGELSLAGTGNRTTSAIAVEPTTTCSLSREDFIRFIQSNPSSGLTLALTLVDALGARIRGLADRVVELEQAEARGLKLP